jgi:amino acid adenylation domain-containing protein
MRPSVRAFSPPHTDQDDDTIVDRLARWSRDRPDAAAFTFLRSDGSERDELTFRQLWEHANAIAHGLTEIAAPGDRAILAFDSEREFIEAFFGCQIAGVIALPSSMQRDRLGLNRLTAISGHAGARAILTSADTVDSLQRALDVSCGTTIRAVTALPPHEPRPDSLARPAAGDVALIQYTSGSTGAPKGVVLTHRNLMRNQTLIENVFCHDAATVFAGVLPLFHDMGLIGTVLQPVYLGVPCVLISPRAFLRRPACLLQAISRYGVTTSGGPNFVFDLCVDRIAAAELAGVDLSRWSVAFNGAEPVRASTLERFAERFREHGFRTAALCPVYGLAEATLIVAGVSPRDLPVIRSVDRDALHSRRIVPDADGLRLVSCGAPAAKDSIRIVDPERVREVGADTVGEIWVRSDSTASEYWNDASATAQTFGGRLPDDPRTYLRTGDLGFVDSTGALFVTGRSKDLIVVHGENVYPHDVEEVVLAVDPRLGRAAAFQTTSDPSRTVVLIEPVARATAELRAPQASALTFAKARLAIHQAHGIAVDAVAMVASGALPRTTSGKLCRSSAAEAWQAGRLRVIAEERSAPAREVKQGAVAAALAGALGIGESDVGAWLPLVTRGIDSLRAAELASVLEKNGLSCSPAVLLTAGTLKEIESACLPIEGVAPRALGAATEDVPLSDWQMPFWFAHTVRPLSGSYNVKTAVTVRGDFDASLWSQAVAAIVSRHESLRVTIAESPDGVPRQRPCGRAHSTTVGDALGWSEAQVEHRVAAIVNARFDLERGPLFRSDVLRTRHGHVLVLVAHHVVADMWSMATIFKEIVEDYRARRTGRASAVAPARLRMPPARTAAFERAREADLRYWTAALAGEHEALDLPRDRTPPPHAGDAGRRTPFEVGASDAAALRDMCRTYGATLHMALLAVYRILLFRYTGQSDVLIGTPIARRSAAGEAAVGCFINPVAIRCRIDGRSSFAQTLAAVRESALGALRHGDAPFHDVVRAVGTADGRGGHALYQTMFALQKVPTLPEAAPLVVGSTSDPFTIGELELAGYPLRRIDVPFDLALVVAEGVDGLWGCFEYRTSVLDEATAARFARHFVTLVRQVVERPDCPLARLDMLDASDVSVLERFERGDDELAPTPACIHWLIEEQAARTPDAVAVRWLQQDVTYRSLHERSLAVAASLRRRGVVPDDRIGVLMQPSADWIVALLAIWQAGAAVVPLDGAMPRDRARDIANDSRLKAVVTDGRHARELPDALGALCLGWSELHDSEKRAERQRDELDVHRLAYIAFTSGSAGRPKGVMITHRAASNFAVAQADRLERAALGRVLQFAPSTFDAVYADLFMSLTTGGTLCIAPPEARIPGRELMRFINAERITLVTATPSVLAALAAHEYPYLHAVISMGETCFAESARHWSRFATFYNGYGPTEASIGTTLNRFGSGADARSETVSIGQPFANCELYVLDGDLNRVPAGVPGELVVGGAGIARGYVDHADWTAERFVPNPYGRAGDRMYRTGDRGRWLPSGGLEFLARLDRQAKVRGVRIEPEEVEAVLRAHDAVRDCYVDVASDPAGATRLIAYVVGPRQSEAADVVAFLRGRFPSFMLPAAVVCVDGIPVRPNGKVDRGKLPRPEVGASVASPVGDLEARLCTAWSEVLGAPAVGIDDNFFDAGGHSLLLARLQSAVEHHAGRTVTLLDLFDHPTIRTLALHLLATATTADDGPVQPDRLPAAERHAPIAIIGMACRLPGADDVESFWRNVVAGRESITFFSEDELAAAGVSATGSSFVPARGAIEGIEFFDAAFFGFSQREAEVLDPQKRVLLELAQACLDDAGYAPADGTMQNDVGVFVGTSRNSYFENNVASHRDILDSLGPLKVGIASDGGFAATLIGYKLNLSGPCLNVETACSTSLVAVHQACLSLWSGECRMALAGGASIDVPTVGGHRFTEGMIGSPDGHCRAFDAMSAGTVKGMGAGVVVLKPLDAALNDGDHVYAVIRGSAINNDGARKLGFTAPSPEGQAVVVRRALNAAHVPAATLGYVEAHGTGTALGDAIEVAALNRALEGAPARSIAIGSVKSNIGHLDAASGVAGLIKCALAVSRGLIPPQVHFTAPNPNVDLDGGPLYVPTNLREWPHSDSPRRAGVSSFGIGGTNAHVVLEQAPEPAPRDEADGPFLIPLSAGSPTALRRMARELSDAVRARRPHLADVARTLAAGRRRLAWRTSFVCDDADALAERLASGDWVPVCAPSVPPPVLLRFPGAEAAFDVHAAAELVRALPALGSAIDECLARLTPVDAAALDRVFHASGGDPAPLAPELVQPAIFAVEYAFWSLLRACGVQPGALVGEGIGELVALCAAGSVSLEAGLRFACEWGRLDGHAPTSAGLRAFAESIAWSAPRVPVFSAATGGRLEAPDAAHWATVAAGPRRLDDALARAAQTASGVAVEARIGSPDAHAHALRTLANLWEIGVPVDLQAVVAAGRRVSLPGVTFDRARLWLDPVARTPLPAADVEESRPAVAGREIVAELWKSFLGASSAEPEDDYFSCGGDSLLAIQFAAALAERLGITVSPDVFFEHSTFGALCDFVAPASKPAGHPLSREQRGLWLANETEGAGAALNLSVGLRFDGPLDVEALQDALRTVCSRHAIVLNNFAFAAGDPVQWRAHEPAELVLVVHDAGVAEWDGLVEHQANAAFSVSSDLLVRATLLTCGGRDHMLAVTVHHLVADGWSLLVMLREVAALYAGPGAALPDATSYAHYVAAQSSRDATHDHRAAGGARARDLPAVELPATKSPAAPASDAAGSIALTLEPELVERIRAACRDQGRTLFTVLLAAFEILVRRFIDDDDVVVAAPVMNRDPREHRDTVGPFVHLAMFHSVIRPDHTFADVARFVREDLTAALDPHDARFDDFLNSANLHRGSATESPCRIAFALNHAAPAAVSFGPATTARPVIPSRRHTRHRVMMWVDELGTDLRCTLEFRAAYYDDATMHRYLDAYTRVLDAVTRDPNAPVGSIELLSDDDRSTIDRWNDTAAPSPPWTLAQHEIARVAACTPHAVAITYEGRDADYATLDAEARRIALLLLQRGVAVEEPVGVLLDRGIESVVAAVGVLYAGGCYVPLDPDLPAARIRHMIACSAVRYVITDGVVPGAAGGAVLVDFAERPLPEATAPALPVAVHPCHLAYVLFTSGSTGAPKGVMVDHRALANRLDWMTETLRFGPADRILHKTSVSFDVCMWEMLAPLVAGATIVVARPGGQRDASYLSGLITRQRVTIAHFVPSMLQVFLDTQTARAPSLRFLVCSGETLRTDVYERACAWLGDRRKTVNLYGPTEAAIDVTAWINADGRDGVAVSIGRPIRNIRIHILDTHLHTVPVGVTGDVYISGIGLARGYVGSPHLTAEHFVPDPRGCAAVMYRTGDRGRWTATGEIEYRGRADLQVKVRGMRVELGEIEAALRASAFVSDAAVTVDGTGEHQRLIAHVVPRRGGDAVAHLADDLRAAVAARLPHWMVPDAIVLIDRMPVTQNGKLDRAALPAADPWPGRALHAAEPDGPFETKLAALWRRVLDSPQPTRDTDFFRSGGNSLLALRLVSAIESELGARIDIHQLFEHSSFARLAAVLQTATAASEPFVVTPDHSARFEPFPMTQVQQAYAIGRSSGFELGNISTNCYMEIEARGIDEQRFANVLNRLIRRHDMLRATACGEGLLRVLPEVSPYEPARTDLASYDAVEREETLAAIRSEMSELTFDIQTWPLFQIRLTRLAPGRHVVHLTVDALILDGASAVLLERDFNRLYLDEEDALPAAPSVAYRDYAVARAKQRSSDAYRAARTYWASRLDELPEAPRLPLRVAPSTIRRPRFKRLRALLDAVAWHALQARAPAHGVTAASVLIAAYAEVLARWSGEDDFIINLPVTSRPTIRPDVDEIVGNFTSTLHLQADLRGLDGFEAVARRVQHRLWSDLAHLAFDGVELQRLRSKRQRTFAEARAPIVFTGLLGLPQPLPAPQRHFDLGRDVEGVSRTSQVLLDCIAVDRGDALVLNWDHVAEAFPDGMVEAMFEAYAGRLRSLASSDAAWLVPLPPALPRWRAPDVNVTSRGFERETLSALVLGATRRFASRTAVVSAEVALSYADLRELAGGLAARLLRLGLQRGDAVAVYADKGWEQVVAAVAVVVAGGAYVPVEASLPPERRRQIVNDSGARFVVTQPWLVESVADCGIETVIVTYDGPRDDAIVDSARPGDLAYIIFTSGSTGRPKGVAIEHGAAANTICDVTRRFGVNPEDTALGVSGFGFDLSVYDMFGLLSAGGKLVLPDAGRAFDAEHWWQLVHQHRVTIFNATPVLAAHLVAQAEHAPPAAEAPLRLFLLSGDWIPLDLPARIRSVAPAAVVVSLGGATEASIWSIFYPVGAIRRDWKSIPYGEPLSGQDVVVLDRGLEHCPAWVTGDIYIAGFGLAREYWNEPKLTARAFSEHPRWQTRLYRTGDLGRYLPDGNIEFLGRNDSQVKLNGVRLELGEVESAIELHPGIDRVVVLADRQGSRDVQRLIAYVSLCAGAIGANAARELSADARTCEESWQRVLFARTAALAGERVEIDRETFRAMVGELEGQYRAAVVELFAGFARFAVPGEHIALSDLLHETGIAPRYRAWMARALAYLADAGCVRQVSAEVFEVVFDVTQLRDAAVAAPDVPLGEVLREDVHSAQLYAVDGTAASYQVYYHVCHQIAAAVIADRARGAADRALRVLEVGAGYGSLTQHVLPVMRPHDSYAFTDISPYFLTRAAERFAQYEFLTFDHFDIEADPQVQGHERHRYDVVLAASVLHNAKDIAKALVRLRSALAPGGVLLLIEETSFFPFFDLGMGLQQGFGDFADPLRPHHPLLSRDGWRAALEDAGFVRSAVLNRDGSVEDAFGFDVIVAQAPETVTVFDGPAIEAHLERFLPRSAVPASWIQLDDFPRTASGKIDRQSLSLPRPPRERDRPDYVAPRSETESVLAQIWCNALSVTRVGALDDFFDIGGDSLVAARVAADVRKHFGFDIQLRALFETTTVEALAALIDAVARQPEQRIPSGFVTGEL